jgi:heme a synthase
MLPRMKPLRTNVTRRPSSTAAAQENSQVENELKPIAYWLFGVASLVAGMVTVGGITRLTRSGLSMTDWKLQGSLPPMNHEEWLVEFERYKKFPEWQQRKSMTLDEFKYIYFWEYGHRMMGRGIGLAYALPLVYFSARGMVPVSLYPRLGLLFGLGGAQGLVGWWMVKSGLEVDKDRLKEIRVSPYRLATHLGMAFTTYTAVVWTGLDLIDTKSNVMSTASSFPQQFARQAKGLRLAAILNGGLVATTVISGAYVAGNDAGHAYNSFPKMGDHWIPPEVFEMKPYWKNFFENSALVQFNHRILALTTLGSITYSYYKARYTANGALWRALPSFSRVALNAVAGMSAIQVGLGITTLLLYVPIPLAATHQAGSLVLLTCITCAAHSLKFLRFLARI